MLAGSFLTLDSLLLPPPGPAVVAFFLVVGMHSLGRLAVRHVLRIEQPDGLQQAAGFVLATALLAASVHLLALLDLASLIALRAIGAAVIISGGFLLSGRERASLAARLGKTNPHFAERRRYRAVARSTRALWALG